MKTTGRKKIQLLFSRESDSTGTVVDWPGQSVSMSRITRDLTKETINKDDIYTNLNKLNESEHEMKMNWRQMLEWFFKWNEHKSE